MVGKKIIKNVQILGVKLYLFGEKAETWTLYRWIFELDCEKFKNACHDNFKIMMKVESGRS